MGTPEEANFYPSSFQAADGLFLRVENAGVEHVVNRELNQEFLKCDSSVAYPEISGIPALDEVLLETFPGDNNDTYLLLPENYVTMSQALNDAIGDNPNSESFELAQQLFRDLGVALAQMISESGMAPSQLSYRDILLLRQEPGIKFLPPLELIPLDEVNTRTNLTASLLSSCSNAASNTDQRQSLVPAFKEFIRAFSW